MCMLNGNFSDVLQIFLQSPCSRLFFQNKINGVERSPQAFPAVQQHKIKM